MGDHDGEVDLGLERHGFFIFLAVVIESRVVYVVREEVFLEVVVFLGQQVIFVQKYRYSVLDSRQDKSFMGNPAFLTFFQHFFIFSLDDQILPMAFLTRGGRAHCKFICHSDIVRSHVPELDVS